MTGGVITEAATPSAPDVEESPVQKSDVRRFTISALIGSAVGAIPFLWILWDMFIGHVNVLRLVFNGNFYDAQARAIMNGHLYIPRAVLQIEGFKHAGHYYTYFGIFPSLLRIPLLYFDSTLAGELTAPSILLAWALSALLTAMLVWRARILVRGSAPLSKGEAACHGALIATVTGGSIFLLLASMPWVYDEDAAWSIALTLGALFCLLGILERPTRGRVLAAGVFMLAGNFNRLPTAWACVIGAVLVAMWFRYGPGKVDHKRWAFPLLGVAVFAVAAGCVVNFVKFGTFFGLPLSTQVFTSVNTHRRVFLALSGNRGWGPEFLPTTLWTYFQPFGIHFQSTFPFVTLPTAIPAVVGKVVFDQTYRTASVPASMPLLFVLACIGIVASFRRRISDSAKLLRIPLFAAAGCFGVTLMWGYMAPRFESDFIPLLVFGSGTGLIYIWGWIDRRQATRQQRCTKKRPVASKRLVVTLVFVATLFSMIAAFGIAVTPQPAGEWTMQQVAEYVSIQKTLSDVTGHPLAREVTQGTNLPYFAPAGALFVEGNCQALYLSTGESFANDPEQQKEHSTWVTVEPSPQVLHIFSVNLLGFGNGSDAPIPLVSVGPDTFFVQYTDVDTVQYGFEGPGFVDIGLTNKVHVGATEDVAISADPTLQFYSVVEGGHGFDGFIPSVGPVVVHTQSFAPGTQLTSITEVPDRVPQQPRSMCRSLLKQSKHLH